MNRPARDLLEIQLFVLVAVQIFFSSDWYMHNTKLVFSEFNEK